jgi:hypothetical protein
MEDSDFNKLLAKIKTSPSPVSRWFGGIPVRARNGSITVLFTARKEMTDENDIVRTSILSAMAEETLAMFQMYYQTSSFLVREVSITGIVPITNSESLLVRMRLTRKDEVRQLRFRIIGKTRRALAWGVIQCEPPAT